MSPIPQSNTALANEIVHSIIEEGYLLKNFSKASKRSAAIAGLVVAALLAAVTPASAWTGGELVICSGGNYDTYVKFPERGGMTSLVAPKGSCTVLKTGTSNVVERIEVRGIYNTSDNTFWVANGSYRPRIGGGVTSYGTTAQGNHWAMTPQF